MSEVMISQRRPLSRHVVTAEEMVSRVERALLTEVRLTPKPGLVDIRNAGAHRDMDLASFEASTAAVAPWMEKFFIMGHDTANITPEQVLTMLRPVGMACETDMLEATGGVNTHRGAIFAFGLLSAAAGRLVARGEPVECGEVIIYAWMDRRRENSEKPYGTRLGAGQAVSARLVGK